MGRLADSFVLGIPGVSEDIDADIDISGTTVTPRGSGSEGVFDYVVNFTYVTGDPPATAFEMTWTSTVPPTTLPSLGTIAPSSPQGSGSMVRTGTIAGSVSASVTTAFSGSVTIVQA